MVFTGTILQSITVKVLAKRAGFKGGAGTVFPFLCTVLTYLLLYYQGIYNYLDGGIAKGHPDNKDIQNAVECLKDL